jgi:hypothetical protein
VSLKSREKEVYTLQLATGASTGKFKIADRVFHDRPLRIREVNEYLGLAGFDAQGDALAQHLTDRIADAGEPISVEFLNEHLSFTDLQALSSLLLYGRVVSGPN